MRKTSVNLDWISSVILNKVWHTYLHIIKSWSGADIGRIQASELRVTLGGADPRPDNNLGLLLSFSETSKQAHSEHIFLLFYFFSVK